MLYKLYIKYIRYRIFSINNVNDLIYIFKNINFFYKNVTTDALCEIIIDCLKKYPLTETELQKISLLEQNYTYNLGIENYATCILWLCVIQSIQETIMTDINKNTEIKEMKTVYKINNKFLLD